MRSLIALLCVILTVSLTSLVCSDSKVDTYDLKSGFPTLKSSFTTKLSWFIGDYDLDRIEDYINGYYKNYYKSWERYLVNKQREFASTFGLTNILFKPDFRHYDNTKLVLSKNVWDDRLAFRYIAPIGDMTEFDFSVAFKPYKFITLIGKGNLNGDGSAVILINRPFGTENNNNNLHQKTNRLVKEAKRLAKTR